MATIENRSRPGRTDVPQFLGVARDLDGDGRRDLAILAAENSDGVRKLVVLPQRCAP